ncbi:MAG: hypothetical protein IM551_00430 [Chitinophagaceae bacterium]|nr:hypothetical protein [Chitinophagaceae bacterium]
MEEELFKLNATVQVTNPNSTVTHGLTKREYFAGKALQGLLSIYDNNEQNPTVPNEENVKYMAKLAVQAADALIAELNK